MREPTNIGWRIDLSKIRATVRSAGLSGYRCLADLLSAFTYRLRVNLESAASDRPPTIRRSIFGPRWRTFAISTPLFFDSVPWLASRLLLIDLLTIWQRYDRPTFFVVALPAGWSAVGCAFSQSRSTFLSQVFRSCPKRQIFYALHRWIEYLIFINYCVTIKIWMKAHFSFQSII